VNKALLLADIHCGARSDSETFLNNFEQLFLSFIPSIAKQNLGNYNTFNVFILGDFWDNRNHLSVKTINVVLDTLSVLFEQHPYIKITMICGNHDIYYKNTKKITSLKIFHNKFPNNIEIVLDPKKIIINRRKIMLAPWVITEEDMKEIFSEKMDIALGHFNINGFELVKGVVEDGGESPNKFREMFSLTFSGHFHIRSEKDRIIYVGNPYPLTWNDSDMIKGGYLLDFDTLQYEFIENTYCPIFKKVYLSHIKKKIIDLKKSVPNNFIKLILDDIINASDLDRLNYMISSLEPLSFDIADGEKDFGYVDVSDDISATSIDFLNEYIDGSKFDEEIDKTILKRKMNELYIKNSNI